ncbi:hypothetical protein R6Q59_023987 [Mikania micrantha]
MFCSDICKSDTSALIRLWCYSLQIGNHNNRFSMNIHPLSKTFPKPNPTLKWFQKHKLAPTQLHCNEGTDERIQQQNNRKNGENDETVMNEVLMTYARENRAFFHITVCQVMRKSTIWHPVPKLQTSKQTKTSLSDKYTTIQSEFIGRCFLDLNESDEEVEMDMPPPSPEHPPG